MSPSAQILLSGALSFGVPLALAARELLVLRRRGSGPSPPWEPPAPPPSSPRSWQPSLPPLRPAPVFPEATDSEPGHAVRSRELA